MTHCKFGCFGSIQNRFDRPVAYVKGITVTVDNRDSLISYLDNSQETGGRTTVNPCSQVPLVRILRSGDGGRHYETVRLGQRKNMSSKKLCHSHPSFDFIICRQRFLCRIHLKFRRTMQQPLPADSLRCFQFIIHNHRMRMKHQHMSAVFSQRSGTESIFRRLLNTCLLEVANPHRVIADTSVSM